MPIHDRYRRQVRLLMRLLPIVAAEPCFALKGGTAINLFLRDMPRLSVDIDLTYLPTHDRAQALTGIDAAMTRIATAIRAAIPGVRITETRAEGAILRLLVLADATQVKIELSPVLRGVVGPPTLTPVTEAVEEAFGFAEIQVVSFEDLYAGKLVAALDRQHPRDLHDVHDLLANEGLTDALRRAFLIYLISHNRPMGEVLSGRVKDLRTEFRNGFEGMTETALTLDTLLETRTMMIDSLVGLMPDAHRRFLLGFERGAPDWSIPGFAQASTLPAVRRRQRNLDRLSPQRRGELVALLQASLARRAE